MDDQSLKNVLAILRSIVSEVTQTNGAQVTGTQYVTFLATGYRSWVPAQTNRANIDNVSVLRVATYLGDQFAQARAVIDNSQLVDEAKAGVRAAILALEGSFSLSGLQMQLQAYIHTGPGFISNLVILLSAAGLSTSQSIPQEATDLAAEVDHVATMFGDAVLDPVVRDVAKRHLAILSTLIRHIPIFGLEAALEAYFELVLKLRRADSKSTESSRAGLDGVMGTVFSWGEKLHKLDGLINTGANLLHRAHEVVPLLQYVPLG